MAAGPLFDYSRLDMSAVAVSPERVAEINPQRGDMRQVDHLIWVNEQKTSALGVKYVRDDEFWVSGHIPGRPLLPGVLMIEAAAQLSSTLNFIAHGPFEDRFVGFARCNNVSFRGQVVPGDTLHLLAVETAYRRRRFESCTQGWVNGALVFEADVTGMLM